MQWQTLCKTLFKFIILSDQKTCNEMLTYIFIIEFYSLLPFLSNQIFTQYQYLFFDLFLYFAHKILLSCYLKRTNIIEYICVNMSRGFK